MTSLSNVRNLFNKKGLFFFKSSKELTLVVKSGKDHNSGYPKMVNTVWVNADHGRDLHPLADHMTKSKISHREKIVIFQHFDFHLS